MQTAFTYDALPYRAVFGAGSRHKVAEECEALGVSSILVLTTPEQIEQGRDVAEALGDKAAGVYAKAKMHTPIEVTEDGLREVERLNADAVLAVGGGSTIGLGKAITRRTGLPQIVIPTTYAGSEMTPIAGETIGVEKTTIRGPNIQPKVVIYDVELTMTLPLGMTVVSGMNAMAHAIEAIYAKNRSPVTTMMSVDAVRAMGRALRILAEDDQDREGRELAQYGAWLCGAALGATDTAFHHKLCHTLGGTLGLPHAETHTIVLPYATAFNESAGDVAEMLAPAAEALGAATAAEGLFALNREIGAPRALSEFGMRDADIPKVADVAMRKPYWNPRAYDRHDIETVLGAALTGADLPKL